MTQAPAAESRKRITLLLGLDGSEAFVEQGTTGLSIDCGGSVITRSLKDWHAIAAASHTAAPAADRAVSEPFEQAWQRRPMHGAGTPVDGPREKALVELGWRLAHDAAPPADRAELAAECTRLVQEWESLSYSEARNLAWAKVLTAIDALADVPVARKADWELRLEGAAAFAEEYGGHEGCACRWDEKDNRVATCARHQGWLDVIGEWSERAKSAEAALATPPAAATSTPCVSGEGPALFLGRTYQTQGGETVKMVSIHAAGLDHETMADENGCHRYSRRAGDVGRVTGIAHDYSDPDNIVRLAATQAPAVPATDAPSRHPMQPLMTDAEGIVRFKANTAVVRLLEEAQARGFGLNELATAGLPAEDHTQLAQLIGYSLSGFGELSYVSDADYERAALTQAASTGGAAS